MEPGATRGAALEQTSTAIARKSTNAAGCPFTGLGNSRHYFLAGGAECPRIRGFSLTG